MKRWFILVALMAAGLARLARAEEVAKVGFVDMQRALEETEDGRKARDRLKKELEAKQKELNEREEEIKKQVDDLQKKRTLLPADKVREKEEQIQKQMQEAQGILVRHQQTLQQKEQEALAPIYERMQRIIYKMAQAENFTVIMDRRQVIFAKPHLDLTNELIRRFNSGEEAGGKGPPKGAPPPAGAPAAAPAKKK